MLVSGEIESNMVGTEIWMTRLIIESNQEKVSIDMHMEDILWKKVKW
jgi:hypothetical protein